MEDQHRVAIRANDTVPQEGRLCDVIYGWGINHGPESNPLFACEQLVSETCGRSADIEIWQINTCI